MLVWWETILSGFLLRFFFVFLFCLYVWNKFHDRFLLLRYSDAGTFNLVIVKIGFIKIFYSEVRFVKPSQMKSKRFRKLRLLFRTNSFWKHMNKYHPSRAMWFLSRISVEHERNHCGFSHEFLSRMSKITAVSVTNFCRAWAKSLRFLSRIHILFIPISHSKKATK